MKLMYIMSLQDYTTCLDEDDRRGLRPADAASVSVTASSELGDGDMPSA